MSAFLFSLTFAAAVQSTDAHVPSWTVAGDVVTFDAEIAWLSDPRPAGSSFELVNPAQQAIGSQAIGFNSGNVYGSIEWKLSPGEWRFVALGHADDLANPSRQLREFSIVIDGQSREQRILDLVVRYLEAKRDLALMDPPANEAEILTALIEAVTSGGL